MKLKPFTTETEEKGHYYKNARMKLYFPPATNPVASAQLQVFKEAFADPHSENPEEPTPIRTPFVNVQFSGKSEASLKGITSEYRVLGEKGEGGKKR